MPDELRASFFEGYPLDLWDATHYDSTFEHKFSWNLALHAASGFVFQVRPGHKVCIIG
jgi:hypothetical protein